MSDEEVSMMCLGWVLLALLVCLDLFVGEPYMLAKMLGRAGVRLGRNLALVGSCAHAALVRMARGCACLAGCVCEECRPALPVVRLHSQRGWRRWFHFSVGYWPKRFLSLTVWRRTQNVQTRFPNVKIVEEEDDVQTRSCEDGRSWDPDGVQMRSCEDGRSGVKREDR